MNYFEFLEHSFRTLQKHFEELTREEYLSNYIFDFTTYDSNIDELFARKALDVCHAITHGKTFEYAKWEENYQWYLIMCNMPFFKDKLEWGTSIRGAWWNFHPNTTFKISSCGFWIGEKQILEPIEFTEDAWVQFIEAMERFINET